MTRVIVFKYMAFLKKAYIDHLLGSTSEELITKEALNCTGKPRF